MTDLFAGWRFAIRRLRANWRFMLVAALGVLVASTLLAITPMYAASMSDLGLTFRLDRELPEASERFTYAEVDRFRLGDAVDEARADAMDTVTAERLAWLAPDVLSEDRTQRFDLSFSGHESPDDPIEVTGASDDPVRQLWGGFVHYLSGWEDHVDVVDGRLPGPASDGPEVVLPDGFQRHAVLGDTVRIESIGFDDCPDIPPSDDPTQAAEEVVCRPTSRIATALDVTVVGFVRPHDAGDDRWEMFSGTWEVADAPFYPRLERVDPADPLRGLVFLGIGQMAMLTTEEQFDGVFRVLLPETVSRHRSGVVVDTSRLGLGEVQYAIRDMQAWLSDIRGRLDLTAPARTDVLSTLQGFETARSFSAVPLLVVLLQVVGIVIYYVTMVMAMLLERQREEIGVYRSRGASTTQLVGLSFVEGLAFAVPALLVAPWLASQVVALLGLTPTFQAITGGARLPVSISPEAYLLAVGGAALSLLAVLLPAFVIVRRGIVDVKREESRPAERNVFQRYYLDFALVALSALLLWQLNQRGSVFDPDAVGGWSSDPVLLAAPFAITAAVSVMVLRFYPPLIRLAVRMLLVFRSTAAAIGLRRAGRAPASYARVALLVIMAVAVGTFAASYGPTVERSLEERARYQGGTDLRALLYDDEDRALGDKLAALEEVEGVLGAEGVYRGTIRTPSGREIPLLAVDPAVVRESMWWRDDFALRPLDDLMRLLQSDVPPGGGYVLPEGTQAVEIAVRSNQPDRVLLRGNFRRPDGSYETRSFDVPEVADRWVTAQAEVPFGDGPMTLAGLVITDRTGKNLRVDGSMSFDELAAVLGGGEREVLEDFEGPMQWTMFTGAETIEEFALDQEEAAEGEQSVTWTWGALVSPRKRILAPGDPSVPLSVIMGPRAMGEFRTFEGGPALAQVGQVALPLRVRAAVDYFPTMDPRSGIVIANLEHLRAAAGLLDFANYAFANELWVDLAPSMSLSTQRDLLDGLGTVGPQVVRGAVLQAGSVESAEADPTLQAAGSGILSVAFIAVLGLCTVGFVVTMVLGARSRAVEFAVLRAVGASRREILRALLLEWGVVLVAGAVIGGLVGRRVATVMLDFLNVTETGSPVLPPFVLQTDWTMLGLGLGVLAGVVLASLIAAWAVSMRRSPTIELRLTQ